MSDYVFFSLLLSGALTALWAAYRLAAIGCRVIGRAALMSLLPVALLAAAMPFLLAEPEVITVRVVPVPDAVVTVAPEAGEAIAEAVPVSVPDEPASLWPIINAVYIAGVGLSLLYMLFTLIRIGAIIRRSERVEAAGGRLRVHDCDSLVPFAWGRWIVMSRADYCANGPMLMAHERTHLRRVHWLDLSALNLLQCLTWYWPAIWLIRRELVAAHEAEADRAVLSAGFPAEEYQMLLIKKASGRRFANSVTAGLNYSLIKSRIIMMKKPISATRRNLRALALAPACMLVMFAATSPVFASKASDYLPAVIDDSDAVELPAGIVDTSRKQRVPDNVDIYINGEKSDSAAYGALSPDKIESITVDKTVEPAAIYVETNDRNMATIVAPERPTRVVDSSRKQEADIYIDGEKSDSAAYAALSTDQIYSITVDKTVEPTALYVTTKDSEVVSAFETPDVKPEFPGGETKMFEFMAKNMRYPTEAAVKGIQGVVNVRFIVLADGKIGPVEVKRGVDPLLDGEAVRVVKSFPAWTPGKVNGKPVNCWYSLPVSFKMQ